MAYSTPKYLSNNQYGYKAPAPAPRYQRPEYVTSQEPHRQYTLGQKISRFLHNPIGIYKASAAEPGGFLGPPRAGTQQSGEVGPVYGPTRSISLPAPTVGGATGGSGGGISAADQAAIDYQRAQIAAARKRLAERSTRYGAYFDAQSAELERQKLAEEAAIANARAEAGTQAQRGREKLGAQNTQSQATINKTSQAAGIFDSSARIGAIGYQQNEFEGALKNLNESEAKYYTQLDDQLNNLKAQYQLNRQNLDLSKFDNAQDLEERLAAFDQAEKDLDAKIASVRESAISRASQSATGLQDVVKFANDILQIPDQFHAAVYDKAAPGFGLSPTQLQYYVRLVQAQRLLQDPATKAQGEAIIRQLQGG